MDKKPGPRKLVLCFDGTGNKFHGDDSDSNILKIYRMLDRSSTDQYHYYQPGIGTYITSSSLSQSGTIARITSQYKKAKDSAIGSTFDHHVVAGYRFLMRYYQTGDEIYMFSFSRGAYIVRFLAEMLDYIGLLSNGNEEMIRFAWKAFSQWQRRRKAGNDNADNDDNDNNDGDGNGDGDDDTNTGDEKTDAMYAFMKNFRETFSRPVGRIRFLGLFDTVNSVSRFESAWMRQRTKFPYTARSSAQVIRHAVSIDERRAKFRQDLLYQNMDRADKKHGDDHHHHHPGHHLKELVAGSIRQSFESHRAHTLPDDDDAATATCGAGIDDGAASSCRAPSIVINGIEDAVPDQQQQEQQQQPPPQSRGRTFLAPDDATAAGSVKPRQRNKSRSKSRCRQHARYRIAVPRSGPSGSAGDAESECNSDVGDDDDEESQDIDEVWFAGGHGDIGGGWPVPGDDRRSASHVPLTWIVREASKAGLEFDWAKVAAMGCWGSASGSGISNSTKKNPNGEAAAAPLHVTIQAPFDDKDDNNNDEKKPQTTTTNDSQQHQHHPDFVNSIHRSHTSRLHDSLIYGDGLGHFAVTAWRIMEWMPFQRMDLQHDGSWRPIRWPLPRGEVRDMPPGVRVHGSVLGRLRADAAYRPGNLIVGGGGRGLRVAPAEFGIGEWECVSEPGDPVGEIWTRRCWNDEKMVKRGRGKKEGKGEKGKK